MVHPESYLDSHESQKWELVDDPNDYIDTLLQKDIENEKKVSSSSSSQYCCCDEFPKSELDWIHKNNPKSLIGKPVRLYCPVGNSYHNGRIVDIRPHQSDTECRIRFNAGSDYRKVSLTSWIRLEEHCVAVAVTMLHAKLADKKWAPVRVWYGKIYMWTFSFFLGLLVFLASHSFFSYFSFFVLVAGY